MVLSRLILRILTLILILAGILLLRKPAGAQTIITAAPTLFIMYDQPAAFDKAVQAFLKP